MAAGPHNHTKTSACGAAGLTCPQRQDADGRLPTRQLVSDGLQDPQNPAHRPITPTDQDAEAGHLLEQVESGARTHARTHTHTHGQDAGPAPRPSAVLSPRQRAAVAQVEDLMRVEKLAEAVEQLPAPQPAALWVDEHQERTRVRGQAPHLRNRGNRRQQLRRFPCWRSGPAGAANAG